MTSRSCTAAVLALALLAAPASAQFIDLSSWTPLTLDLPGGQSAGNWNLSADNTSVIQTVNADPSFFLNNQDDSAYTMNGTWRVETTGDDDLMGFAFGYQDAGHCYIMDWKQNAQSAYGFRDEGFVIRKMHGDPAEMVLGDYWAHEDGQERYTILATSFGAGTGWDDNTDYHFTLDFAPGQFTVTVREGETVLWNTTVNDSEYLSGQFAFYNFSQASVRYSGFTQNLTPICDAGGPYQAPLGEAITFDGSGATDPDGEIADWTWDFGDGNTGSGVAPVHTYDTMGVYIVTLCVTDAMDETSCCETVATVTEQVAAEPTTWSTVKRVYR
ncbi:MAG: PKD domain-containing protein [Candidatus Krumholzibacteriia bacterium]